MILHLFITLSLQTLRAYSGGSLKKTDNRLIYSEAGQRVLSHGDVAYTYIPCLCYLKGQRSYFFDFFLCWISTVDLVNCQFWHVGEPFLLLMFHRINSLYCTPKLKRVCFLLFFLKSFFYKFQPWNKFILLRNAYYIKGIMIPNCSI